MSAGDGMGPIDYRRRTQQTTSTVTITFRYLKEQYKTFLAWWITDLKYGHTWFTINLPSARGNVQHYARFTSKFTATKSGYRRMDVNCELEIRERQIVSEEEVLILTSGPYPYMGVESLDLVADFESGFTSTLFLPESIDFSGDFESGTVTVTTTYVTYSLWPFEATDISADFEDGSVTVTTTYVTYSLWPFEDTDISADFEGGSVTVTTTYVSYVNWPAEATDLSADFEAGTLEIA